MWTSFVALCVLFGRIATCVPSGDQIRSDTKAGLDDETRQYIEALLERSHVPSLSVAVLKGNETYLDAFGHAILPDTLATPDTLYYVGSCSKSFTAASVLYALNNYNKAHDAMLTVESSLQSILGADFAMPDDYATSHATIKDAASHRLGLPRCDVSYGGKGFTAADAVRSLRHLPMLAEFRDRWSYLNLGYTVLQQVVQTLSGRWIGDVHREAIWEPLGMDSTVVNLTDALELDRAGKAKFSYGYSYNPLTGSFERQPWSDSELVGPGGVITSVKDLAKWVRAFMEGGSSLPFSPEDFATLTTPIMVQNAGQPFGHTSPLLYAMGWMPLTYRDERLILHGGDVAGYSAIMAFMPDRQWGISILTNSDATGGIAVNAVFLKLMDDFLGVEQSDREDIEKSTTDRINFALVAWQASRQTFFPSIPDPPVPRSLPVEKYVGRYWNDGFREMELKLAPPRNDTPVRNRTEPVLRADWQRWLNMTLELEWISGEQHLAWGNTEVWSLLGFAVPAEFKIGDDGEVKSVGIFLEPALIPQGTMIWFDKTDGDDGESSQQGQDL
ncbi:hypothetical protein JX265_006224 [Neoarthrinium moseri]|uniref:Beta-lactamase-related domain-containing protein n=1 Tax=Neoarthrinium moseri TaxID=1658444 RepID=A0A9P9WM83_9PEZI|nr:hypothetical protein JX265_006224 [Neoarthrinium moseri]